MANGFETTLSFDLGVAVTNEPICALVQESLAQIGIKVTLNKVPGANWRVELAKKTFPMVVNLFGAGSSIPIISFTGTTTRRIRCSTRCPTRTRGWTN